MTIPQSIEAQRALLKELTENVSDPAIKSAISRILSSRASLEEKLSAIIGLTNDQDPQPTVKDKTLKAVSDNDNMDDDNNKDANPHQEILPASYADDPKEPETSGSASNEPMKQEEGDNNTTAEIPEMVGLREIRKNRKKLKRTIEEAGMLQFFFDDLWKIIPFQKNTGLIDSKFLYLHMRCSPLHVDVYSVSLQKRTLLPLNEFLRQLLSKGWVFLTKTEYNVFSLLRELTESVMAIDFLHLNYQDRDLADSLGKIEQNFLALRSVCQDLNDFSAAIRKAFQNMPELPGSISSTLTLVQRVLSYNILNPSLEQFILAANIVKYRRFLELSDLMEETAGTVISTNEYDAPDHIQTEIRRYLKETESRLSTLVKRRDVLQSKEQGKNLKQNEYEDLAFFYSYGDDLLQQAQDLLDPKKRGLQNTNTTGGNFQRDKSLAIVFTLRFIQRFVQTTRTLLTGTLPLSSGVQRIFSKDLFGYYFEKIDENLSALAACLKEHPHFSVDQLTATRAVPLEDLTDMQKKILAGFDGVLQPLLMIHGLLQKIIQKHVPPPPSVKPGPITIRQTTGETLSIPFSQEFIDQRDVLMGKTVSEALFSLQDILTQFLMILQPETSNIRNLDLEEIEREIFALAKLIKRIGTKEYFQTIRKKYRLSV